MSTILIFVNVSFVAVHAALAVNLTEAILGVRGVVGKVHSQRILRVLMVGRLGAVSVRERFLVRGVTRIQTGKEIL